jgi:hypothetical protein
MKKILVLMILLMVLPAYAANDFNNMGNLREYEVQSSLGGGTMKIVQSFKVVNNLDEPIIPGRAKMILFNAIEPKNIYVNIGGSTINVQPTKDELGRNVIYYDIWQPVLKEQPLSVRIEFDTDSFVQKGLLFKELSMTMGQPDIRIEDLTFSIVVPSNYYVTYTNPRPASIDGNKVSFFFPKLDVDKEVTVNVEYSFIPLPLLPVHGYWLYMIIIFIALLVLLYNLIRKTRHYKKLSLDYEIKKLKSINKLSEELNKL